MSNSMDYYELLGVSKTASQDEINPTPISAKVSSVRKYKGEAPSAVHVLIEGY